MLDLHKYHNRRSDSRDPPATGLHGKRGYNIVLRLVNKRLVRRNFQNALCTNNTRHILFFSYLELNDI